MKCFSDESNPCLHYPGSRVVCENGVYKVECYFDIFSDDEESNGI